MKLSYRGVNCEEAPSTLEQTEGEIADMFRGRNRQFRYLRHIPEPLPIRDRNYHGVSYRPAKTPPPKATLVEQPVATKTLSGHNKREILNEMMNSHLRNIQRSLEHRLKVARAKGDQKLVRLLEVESKQMTLPL